MGYFIGKIIGKTTYFSLSLGSKVRLLQLPSFVRDRLVRGAESLWTNHCYSQVNLQISCRLSGAKQTPLTTVD